MSSETSDSLKTGSGSLHLCMSNECKKFRDACLIHNRWSNLLTIDVRASHSTSLPLNLSRSLFSCDSSSNAG